MKFRGKLSPALKRIMEKRDKKIVRLYNHPMTPLTLTEIALRENITKERVRQIVNNIKSVKIKRH